MVKRAKIEEGGDADQDEEVRSEERDATEDGESSHERAHGGHVPHGGMHPMMKEPAHHHGHAGRARGGRAEGSESLPQEKGASDETPRKRGGRMERKHGGAMPEHMKKAEEHKRHKRAKGGKVPGKAAKHHPGRRARGGSADLMPYTAAGNMSMPDYERAQPGPDEAGKGADSRGGARIARD